MSARWLLELLKNNLVRKVYMLYVSLGVFANDTCNNYGSYTRRFIIRIVRNYTQSLPDLHSRSCTCVLA